MAKYSKEDISNLDLDTLFKVGMNLANKIIGNRLGGMTWDDLPDTNSLWDHISEGMSGDDFIQAVKDSVDERLSEMEDDMDLFEVEQEVPENPEDYTKQPGYISENKKTVQITSGQFQQIIKEGVARLHRQTLVENRIRQINEELGNLNENDTYFESLSQALDVVRDKANSLGYEVDEDSMFSNFGTGGISYETTKSANIELLKDGNPILGKSGRPMNRALSVSIYRMPSGKYELTMYKTW